MDTDNIEPAWWEVIELLQIQQRDICDLLAFAGIDRFKGMPVLKALPRLNLYEDEDITICRNDIDLANARLIVTDFNGITILFQEFYGEFLAFIA